MCTYNAHLFGDSDKCLEDLTQTLNRSILSLLALSQGQNEGPQQLFSQDTSSLSAGSSKNGSQRVFTVHATQQQKQME